MNILVTGGAGFIGSNFVHMQRRLHPDDRIVVLDKLTYAGSRDNLEDRIEGNTSLVIGDICEDDLVEHVLRSWRVDAVVHFAAESHVDRSINRPNDFVRTNVMGTATLLDEARKAGVKRFVHVSTDEVYGDLGPNDLPFTEDTPLAPHSPYSASKAGSDNFAAAWFHTYGFPVTITRCSNNYGPRQFPEKLIPLMILNALAGKPLPVYGDGSNVRDWIHVEDHCAAIDLVLRRGRPGAVYNIGGGSEHTNLDIVRRILALTGRPESLIHFVTDRPGHDRRYAINSQRIQNELGWRPSWDLKRGLADTVEWYRKRFA